MESFWIDKAELAKNRGMSKRSYQYTKSIANLHPSTGSADETHFASSKMDMVALAKGDDVQLEVAFLLSTGEVSTFKHVLLKHDARSSFQLE